MSLTPSATLAGATVTTSVSPPRVPAILVTVSAPLSVLTDIETGSLADQEDSPLRYENLVSRLYYRTATGLLVSRDSSNPLEPRQETLNCTTLLPLPRQSWKAVLQEADLKLYGRDLPRSWYLARWPHDTASRSSDSVLSGGLYGRYLLLDQACHLLMQSYAGSGTPDGSGDPSTLTLDTVKSGRHHTLTIRLTHGFKDELLPPSSINNG